MRNVEKNMIAALVAGSAMGSRNTTVSAPDADLVQRVFLHGHEIATYYRATGVLTRRMCGWPSVTTRSRLNALASAFNVGGFSQRAHVQYHNDIPFDPDFDQITDSVARPTMPSWVR